MLQLIRNTGSTEWFNRVVYQLEMNDVVDTRYLTIFLPDDEAYKNLPYGKKFNLKFYLNELYYVFLQHISIDQMYDTSKLHDGMVIPAGIGRELFINIRENGGVKVSSYIHNNHCNTLSTHPI